MTETREGVELSSLDGPLFDGAVVDGRPATKRDLVDYLDAVAHALIPAVAGRALSVVRVRPGQQPFMQKNLPRYAPDWVARTTVWAEASHREVHYPLCDDRRTLLWLANQRAVEYHPALIKAGERHATHLVLDLDPPEGDDFAHVVRAAMLIRRALDGVGLAGAVKTSGSKGVHIVVPITAVPLEDSAAATRALAARAEALDPSIATTAFIKADRGGKVFLDSTRAIGATVVAAYSPRIRPGLTVSFPVAWDDLDAGHAGRLHGRDGARADGGRRPVGRGPARAAGAAGRAGGAGAHDPRRAGRGDARGQAAEAGGARVG